MAFKGFDWTATAIIGGYHLLLLISLPIYIAIKIPSLGLILTMLILHVVVGIGVTAGYHRLWAHRTYQTNTLVEAVLLFFSTMAAQNSVLKWCHDHRLHHQFVDTEKDPYNIKKGFWYAHMLWIIEKDPKQIDPAIIPDLLQNKLLVWQARHYFPLMLITNVIPTLIAAIAFKDLIGAILFIFLGRMFITHHSTFFINSLAHYWGSKPLSKEHTPVNNWLLGIFTLGEGYHNYHHTFPSDYRNGFKWYHVDPTKLFIWSLAKLRLAWGLKHMNTYLIKRKMLTEDKNTLLAHVQAIHYKELEKEILRRYDQLYAKLSELYLSAQQYNQLRKQRAEKTHLTKLKARIKELRQSVHMDFKHWSRLCSQV